MTYQWSDGDGMFFIGGDFGNPGCDVCGSEDAVVRVGSEYLCASEARTRGIAQQAGFRKHGTIDTKVTQMADLIDAMHGHITGANLIVESTADGHRYQVNGIRWEPTIEHPEGRLILVTSDCLHWSEDCDKGVVLANEQ